MSGKTAVAPIMKHDEIVQIFLKYGHEKRGKHMSTIVIQEIDWFSGEVTKPGPNSHRIILLLKIQELKLSTMTLYII